MKRANKLNRQRIENMYIDYFNNFLSIQRFADHYDSIKDFIAYGAVYRTVLEAVQDKDFEWEQ